MPPLRYAVARAALWAVVPLLLVLLFVAFPAPCEPAEHPVVELDTVHAGMPEAVFCVEGRCTVTDLGPALMGPTIPARDSLLVEVWR